MGDGLLALFQETPGEPEHHAGRALKAALKIVYAARQFRPWIARHFPGQELPEFVVGIGVHTGDVVLCQLTTESGTERTVIGDTVNVAARLEGQSKLLGWSIVASQPTIAAAGARFVVGARASVRLKGRDAAVEVGELIGLSPREGSTVPNWRVYKQFVTAVAENTDALRRSQEAPVLDP
jgi:adenylate cyclase